FSAGDVPNQWVGHTKRTPQTKPPNIDKLPARGWAFTHSYCAAPACNPSRAALMSGLRPSSTGVYHNSEDWRPVISPDLTMVTAFRKGGYFTAGAGKIYHGSFDRTEEWQDYFHPKGNPAHPGQGGVGGIPLAPLPGRDTRVSDY